MCTNLNTPTTTTTTVVLNIECGSILLNGNHEYAEFSLFLFFGDHNFVLCLLLTRFVSVCFVTLYCKDDAKMVPTTPTTKTQTLWITKRYFRFVNLCQNYVHLDVVVDLCLVHRFDDVDEIQITPTKRRSFCDNDNTTNGMELECL